MAMLAARMEKYIESLKVAPCSGGPAAADQQDGLPERAASHSSREAWRREEAGSSRGPPRRREGANPLRKAYFVDCDSSTSPLGRGLGWSRWAEDG